MNPAKAALIALPLFAASFVVHAQSCTATSSERTAALVELYTSEGCDSCPPADRWLAALGDAPQGVVPLALHVDYWDYLGWRDPYARHAYSERQRRLTRMAGGRFVYTPEVFVGGAELRGWRGDAFEDVVRRINARPARARIELAIDSASPEALEVTARAELLAAARDPVLYLASYANRLSSRVTAGENNGRTLVHDHVALEWLGPFPLPRSGSITERSRLALRPDSVARDTGVVAFVQDRATGEVMQALMRPQCGS